MKFGSLILALLFSLGVYSQPYMDVTQLLRQRDFSAFKKFVDSSHGPINFPQRLTREVIPGYWEGMFMMEAMKNSADEPDPRFHMLKVDLLYTGNTIFFYRINDHIGRQSTPKGYWQYKDSAFEGFKNDLVFRSFERAYSNIYKTRLDTTELFFTNAVYGGACGIAGSPTEYQAKLDKLLADDDMTSLNRWLKSPNTEKQLYALQGLKVLQNEGYKLTKEQQRIANIIANKKGLIKACGGCLYGQDSIADVAASIQSFNGIRRRNTANTNYYLFGAIIVLLIALMIYAKQKRRRPIQGNSAPD